MYYVDDDRHKAIDAGRATGVTLQALSEFHERIKFAMSKTVCDIPQTEQDLRLLWKGLLPEEKEALTVNLYKKISELIAAVRDAV